MQHMVTVHHHGETTAFLGPGDRVGPGSGPKSAMPGLILSYIYLSLYIYRVLSPLHNHYSLLRRETQSWQSTGLQALEIGLNSVSPST